MQPTMRLRLCKRFKDSDDGMVEECVLQQFFERTENSFSRLKEHFPDREIKKSEWRDVPCDWYLD